MRNFTAALVVLFFAMKSEVFAQHTAPIETSHFDLVRDVYLSDDIAFGETHVLLRMFVAIGNRNDESEIGRLARAYSIQIQRLNNRQVWA